MWVSLKKKHIAIAILISDQLYVIMFSIPEPQNKKKGLPQPPLSLHRLHPNSFKIYTTDIHPGILGKKSELFAVLYITAHPPLQS